MPPKIDRVAFAYFGPIAEVIEYIEKHFASRLTLSDAAKIARMETKYFSVYFKKRMGIGFVTYLNSRRVTAAQGLMRQKDSSIVEIAHAVGFEDLTTFERRFKRTAGISPREYRKSIRKMNAVLPRRESADFRQSE